MSAPRNDPLDNIMPVVSMLAFAGAWYIDGIYTATAVLMAVMTLHIGLTYALRRHVRKPMLLMWLLVVALGALTLLLRDKAFIQLKTTIVYSVFATALLVAQAMGKSLPHILLANFFAAPAAVWRRLSLVAAVYFYGLAVCNYFVAKHLSEAAWVSIKTFGFPAATFVASLLMVAYLYRYVREEESPQ